MDTVRLVGGVLVTLLFLTRNFVVRQERKAQKTVEDEMRRDAATLSQFVR